eukprot:3158713-Prymnesium_polylepis.1
MAALSRGGQDGPTDPGGEGGGAGCRKMRGAPHALRIGIVAWDGCGIVLCGFVGARCCALAPCEKAGASFNGDGVRGRVSAAGDTSTPFWSRLLLKKMVPKV